MPGYYESPRPRTALTPMTPQLTKLMPDIVDHTISNHLGRSMPGVPNSTSYFNQARNALYSRYTPSTWDASNRANYDMSERERGLAERLRSDAWQVIQSTDQRTRVRQASNTKKLHDRTQDISFWKGELSREIGAMGTEIDNLLQHKVMLEKALGETRGPLAIAEECLLQREKRLGIDLVKDDVEIQLTREIDLIKKCQRKLKEAIDRTDMQLKLDRNAQYMCERDAQDKHAAQDLDDRMHQLHNGSGGIAFHHGIENQDNTLSVPTTWIKFTQENIARSQRERRGSEKLRGEIDALIRQCANDMWNQSNTVNNAFQARVQDTTDAKCQLQAHLQRTNNEIRDMDRMIEMLRKAISDKEGPLKVAQTRLEERTRRLNVELCNDPAMKGLQHEVNEILDSISALNDRLRHAEQAMARLQKTKATLQHDISVKDNSLSIDAKMCMGMRKNLPTDVKAVGPIYSLPSAAY